MFAEERRLHIIDILRHRKRVDVSDLAEQLAISPETIRRDLNELESEGVLKRTHGGAIYTGENNMKILRSIPTRKSLHFEKKNAIAKRAAAFIADGDVIAIDNSTTVSFLLEFIPRDLTVTILTNSLTVVMAILEIPDCEWSCINLGGAVRRNSNSTYGFLTTNSLSFFRPNKLFMSSAGLDLQGALTEGNLTEAEIKRVMVHCSQKTYLLLDDTKIGTTDVVNSCNISQCDVLITNPSADKEKLARICDGKVETIFAEK